MSEQRKDFALYQCAVCKKKFVAADYVSVRKATGKTVEQGFESSNPTLFRGGMN